MNYKEGDTFNRSFIVSPDVYSGFIQLFGDRNPLHTNEDFALKKGFKGKVMHGNILNGFLSYFVGECLPDKNVIIHLQEIKFKKPVYLNSELIFKAIVTGVYDSVNTVEFKYDFTNSEFTQVAAGKLQIGILK